MRIVITILLILLCSFIYTLNSNLKQINKELQVMSNAVVEQTDFFKGNEIK